MVPREYDAAKISRAVATSFLRHLSEPARASLMERAQLVYRPPNQIIIDGHGGFAGVVVSGLLRAYEDSDAGPITVRNVGIGEAVGIASLLGDDDDVWVQAVSASHILRFDLIVVSDLRQRDPTFNLAVGKEAFRRLRDTTAELLLRVHGSIRQRTARQLLDLAADSGEGDPVVVGVTHAAIADAIGSQREVVSRVLGEMSKGGAIDLARNRITISDPLKLRAFAVGR